MTDQLSATVQLADVLAVENAALRAVDIRRAAAMLGRKQAALAALTSATAAGPEQRAAMQAAVGRLRSLAEENRRLLERAIEVQSRVLGVLAGVARRARAPGYGRSGAYATPPPQGWALSARA